MTNTRRFARGRTATIGAAVAVTLALIAPTLAHADEPGRQVGQPVEQPAIKNMAAAAGELSVADLEDRDAAILAGALVGSGVAISNIQYTGHTASAGTFSGGVGAVGFDQGIILSSGAVQTRTDDPCSKGVEGPNVCTGNTTALGTPGDQDLTDLAGYPTHDATVLEFDFVPSFDGITFRYVFASEEYREFANTPYNDTFAFLVNGTNCATVPGTGEPVSVNTINNGNPDGDQTSHNEHLYIDNPADAPARDTEMDGLTVVLTCDASVNKGEVNHMKLAIADASDQILDSNVFIQAGSFSSVPVDGCKERGLAVVRDTGLVSRIVHRDLERLLRQLSRDLDLPLDLGAEVHGINCDYVVPLEQQLDAAIEMITKPSLG